MSAERIRIGIDVGGTFTDFALAKDGTFHTHKVLTTPEAPEQAILSGLATVLDEAGCRPGDVGLVIHGTTLATNAIIERSGATTAMLTTAGFRDVLETGTESRFDQYDLNLVKPEPLVPRHLRLTVTERLGADGSELVALDRDAIEHAAGQLEAQAVQSVAICFLHSFVNPDNEREAARLLRRRLPDLHVSLSSEVSPEIREYERFSTTVANAYVQPLIDRYLQRLESGLEQAGFDCPLYLFLSNGGLAEVAVARRFPIRLVESGPAGGAVFASHIARRHRAERILSFDMGGTTAKICLIEKSEPQKSSEFEMARVHRFRQGSGLPARIPVIEMVEIGAGGGSVARVGSLGTISVGPDSAGSDPGPACYGRGGDRPTVTDADLVLGRLEAHGFAGGSMQLDGAAAQRAIHAAVAAGLRMTVPLAAFGVAEIVEEDMANAAREHAVESGKSLDDRTLIAFGGAAPAHAMALAGKLGIRRVIVPARAGVGSAIGFLLAPVAFESSRSCRVRLGDFRPALLNELFTEMSRHNHEVVASGAPASDRTEIRQAHMRYVGQGYSIPIELPVRELTAADAELVQSSFDTMYTRLYKRLHDGVEVEIVGVSDAVTAYLHAAAPPGATVPGGAGPAQADHSTEVFDSLTGRYRSMPVFDRGALLSGQQLNGPALIRDKGTSIFVPGGVCAAAADDASLVMEFRTS